MKTVYAIVCSASPNIHNIKLYSTHTLALKKLNALANERKCKLGVHGFEERANYFSYLLGWEEKRVSYSITELKVDEDEY